MTKLQFNKNIIFFGTPDFTVDFLNLFLELGFNIKFIVTGVDKPFGRGMQMKSPAPKIWGEQNNIKVLQPNKLDDIFFQEIENEEFDLFIVIAYGKIIPEKIINLPKHGTINLHYSLLPKYRGASPVETAILDGEKETGITIQQMVYKLDAGNILFQDKVEIENSETTNDLREKLNKKAIEIFPKFFENYFSSGGINSILQNENETTICGKFKKDDLNVSLEIEYKDFNNLYKKYKAFNKKIYFFKNNLRIKITEMKEDEILKVLPESKKEIAVLDFEKNFGKIFN